MIESDNVKQFRQIPAEVRAEWREAKRQGRKTAADTVRHGFFGLRDETISAMASLVTFGSVVEALSARPIGESFLRAYTADSKLSAGLRDTLATLEPIEAECQRCASVTEQDGFPATAAAIRAQVAALHEFWRLLLLRLTTAGLDVSSLEDRYE